MGKYNASKPLSESEIYTNAERCEEVRKQKERDKLLDRQEAFQREQLERKLQSIDKLSDSIYLLASAITSYKSIPCINIYTNSDTNSDELKSSIETLSQVFIN